MERMAQERFGIHPRDLMENAGQKASEAVREELGTVRGRTIVVVAGRGNNGGDGFVTARHLARRGARVRVFCAGEPAGMTPLCFTNFDALVKMGVLVSILLTDGAIREMNLEGAAVVVDALFGIGLEGQVRARQRRIIRTMNARSRSIVSLDIPSGLDSDTGRVLGEAVRADVTVTFGVPKRGLFVGDGPVRCGRLRVLDIGIPGCVRDG